METSLEKKVNDQGNALARTSSTLDSHLESCEARAIRTEAKLISLDNRMWGVLCSALLAAFAAIINLVIHAK